MPSKSRIITCRPRSLPQEHWISAARNAQAINPLNGAPSQRMGAVMPGFVDSPLRAAVRISRYWGTRGVHLTVGFLDNPTKELQKKILLHMNAWNKTANVHFSIAKTDPQVRIARIENDPQNDGYWSYVGTEINEIAPGDPTMNLEGFTIKTPDSEFRRVVRHETGHTMGFEHEHMRQQLVQRIDVQKAIAFYAADQHWDEAETRNQVLTPIEASSIRGTAHADPHSIMCYEVPGTITKDGKPIVGGLDIDAMDYAFAELIYPKSVLTSPADKKRPTKKPAKKPARKTAKKPAGETTKSAKKSARKATAHR